MTARKITGDEADALKIASLPTQPTAPKGLGGMGYSSQDMKAAFDRLPLLIIERFNALIDDIGRTGEGSLASAIPTGISDGHTLGMLMDDIKNGSLASYLFVGEVPLTLKLAELEERLAALEEVEHE